MTQDEFKDQLEQFLRWTSNKDRPATSWFASLESWASQEYSRSYNLEEEQRQREGNST